MLLPHNPNAFARSPLDRAGHHRTDEVWLRDALTRDQTLVAAFHRGKPFLYEEGPALHVRWLGGHAPAQLGVKGAPVLFLGVDADNAAYFAFEVDDPDKLGDLGAFHEMRPAAARLQFDKLPILGTARSIFEWHSRNGFCANCGSPSEVAEAGWKRVCPQCSGEHFPRVDPVCIMLPVIGDKCLLGRQSAWPPGMHSALAGFIEPGETIEEGVARETLEEAGLTVREVRLHSTQPWPFPHSLMIGAICEVTDDNEKVDEKELESVRWFTREEAQAMLRGKLPGYFCPPPFAIAHQLLKSWAAES